MMKTISWNIRGLNGKTKQRILKECIKEENPDIVMLQETKCAGPEAEIIFKRLWKDCSYLHTDAAGASGGLAILWNPRHIALEDPFSTVGTLTARYEVIGSNHEGTLTNVYGPQNSQEKSKFLDKLAYIKALITTPS
jgi:exonuclease III